MGKNLIQQARGKGSMTYKSPGHRFVSSAKYPSKPLSTMGVIKDIVHCPGHSAPLMKIKFDSGEEMYNLAVTKAKVGLPVSIGIVDVKLGNILNLRDIPEGTFVSNVESKPGDGGKFVRSSGTFAKVVVSNEKEVIIEMPSKKKKSFNPLCRATIGVIAGGGRLEKPLVKAGANYHKMRARNKLYPRVCGQSMNAIDHPHGGGRSSKKNYPYTVSRHLPPGAKVGLIAARRTGRKK